VPPGKLRAIARHPEYAAANSESVVVGPGGSGEVRVVLSRGATLRARVLDAAGFPLSNARVTAHGISASYERSVVTDASGSATLTGLPSVFAILLARPEDPLRPVFRTPIETHAGADLERDFTLPVLRDAVEWRVENERGDAIELAQVTALSLEPAVPLRLTRFSGSEGIVQFNDVRGLSVRVEVQCPGYLSLSRELNPAPAQHKFVLLRGVNVEGVVTFGRAHIEVVGAEVLLLANGYRERSITSKYGGYTFSGVPPGPVELRVSHRDFAPATMKQDVISPTRDDRTVELKPIELREGASLSGLVKSADGSAAAGVRVSTEFLARFQPRTALPQLFTQTDEYGHFELKNVTPGSVTIYALGPDSARGEQHLEVEAGGELRELELRLGAAPHTEPEHDSSQGVAVTLAQRAEAQIHLMHVAAGSEAERAGLRAGDQLVSVDDARITDLEDARRRLSGNPGTDVVVEVRRDEQTTRYRVRREELRR
jgi:hypothetical protein